VLSLREVRARCAGLPAPTPGEPLLPETRDAAVLIPVFELDGQARVVLTRRPDTMEHHQGEIAFPGGKLDPTVDESARDAALREAEEEIGLPRAAVDIVAELDPMQTFAGPFLISPFVGVLDSPPALVPDPREVERVFDVAISELLADGVHREERWGDIYGPNRPMHFFELEDETVWGATARILAGFLAHLTRVPLPG
jgi:8-oxo-dGTP pyrophosphatase MutT (NUDIX family)